MAESSHDRIERIRKPRVHIRIDVETEGGRVRQELPFVVGVMGEFSGDKEPDKALRDREFVGIDDTTFDEIMTKMAPALRFRVPNTLEEGESELAVELEFKSLEDFEPARIAAQVEPLRKLLETRNRLRDLAAQVDRSDELERMIESILKDKDRLNQASRELDGRGAAEGGEA